MRVWTHSALVLSCVTTVMCLHHACAYKSSKSLCGDKPENVSIEQQVEPRCANHGKESRKAASWTGRVSLHKPLEGSERLLYVGFVTTHMHRQFTGLLRQTRLDPLNTGYLTCKQVFQLTTEGYVGQMAGTIKAKPINGCLLQSVWLEPAEFCSCEQNTFLIYHIVCLIWELDCLAKVHLLDLVSCK